ncbi:MAG: hypothetical protein AAF688_11145 [Bacteroidota bacterium]
MKKISLYILMMVMMVLISCDETESVTFDPIGGQVAISFEEAFSTITIPEAGTTITLNILSTTKTGADRTIPVSIDPSSTGAAADYTVGALTIPANEHIGTLDVTFDNFDGMIDCDGKTLVLNIESGSDAVNGPEQFTFNYTRDFECPDLFLNIEFDDYPGETSWTVTQGGTTLLSGDDYSGDPIMENLCLCPGDYTFTIFDSFGDGICCAYGNGSYEVVFNGNVLFEGGSFGSEASNDFTIE